MSSMGESQPVTPLHRRLIRTDVPGIYRRGSRFVAVSYYRGKKIKTYHRTKTEAKAAKADRAAGARPTSRERFDRYAERWIEEYAGRTYRGLAPSTRAAYGAMLRSYAIPFFGAQRI